MTSLLQSIFGDNDSTAAVSASSAASLLFSSNAKDYAPAPQLPAQNQKRKYDTSTDDDDDDDQPQSDAASAKKLKRPTTTTTATVLENEAGSDDNASKEEKEEEEGSPKRPATTNQQHFSSSSNKEEEVSRTVFVGNLPNSFSRKALHKLFESCGAIASVRLRSIATLGVKLPQEQAGNQALVKKVSVNTGKVDVKAKPSIVGYVVFTEATSVPAALQLNNTRVPDPTTTVVGETAAPPVRHIRVDRAGGGGDQPPDFDATRSVFVGNLPYQTDEETLRQHFMNTCQFATDDAIQGVRVVRNKDTYQCQGFGYVLFRETSSVSVALRQMHGSLYKNRPLRVKVCIQRYKTHPEYKPRHTAGTNNRVSNNTNTTNALRRILAQTEKDKRKKRHRGAATAPAHQKAGPASSRRGQYQAKAHKRAKQLKKRLVKGMGKGKQL